MANGPDKYKYNVGPTPAPPSTVQQSDEGPHVRLAQQDLAGRLRRSEGKHSKVLVDHGSGVMKDADQRIQGCLSEIRDLKDVNRRFQEDNQELRDLCCFLDDDRQKGRKLAREWQRFGRYTASVMRQEVSTYQAKLRELESRQQELIKDNLELKELCLYLDEERVGSRGVQLCTNCGLAVQQGPRDEGDGSSSSTNNDEGPAQYPPFSFPINGAGGGSRERQMEDNLQRQRGIMNEQALQYIRGLEKKIQQLEEEKTSKRFVTDGDRSGKPLHPPPYRKPPCPLVDSTRIIKANPDVQLTYPKPEAVVHAMKVLEVHEQIEKARYSDQDDLADGERALVREMCNVVWKKLEEGPELS